MSSRVEDGHRPVLVVSDGLSNSGVVISCEHASNRLPDPWYWSAEDAWLANTHWAWDVGAEKIARAVANTLGCPLVIATVTRLLVDLNRPVDGADLFREVAEGKIIRLNERLDEEQSEIRLRRFYSPFHERLRTVCTEPGWLLLSIHSFTPMYGGRPRPFDIGVMHWEDHELASAWAGWLKADGYDVRIDEPYAGRDGFMFSPANHAHATGRRALLLEVRNDLVQSPESLAALVRSIVHCVQASKARRGGDV